MIVGDVSQVAIEFHISKALASLGQRASGFFVVHISGRQFGIKDPEATLLACSYDEVTSRLDRRGTHTAPFAGHCDPLAVARAYYNSYYTETKEEELFLGLDRDEFLQISHGNNIVWAPDGDAAFDDSSIILQFDIGQKVRLIGFKSIKGKVIPETVVDMWMESNDYYLLLDLWHRTFEGERESMLKNQNLKRVD